MTCRLRVAYHKVEYRLQDMARRASPAGLENGQPRSELAAVGENRRRNHARAFRDQSRISRRIRQVSSPPSHRFSVGG
jgi:hypothetical protein